MRVKRVTPILQVEAIEPVLSFWTERLGFEVTAEVPHGDAIGFVIFARDGYEVMYQTAASVNADIDALVDHPLGGSMIFIEVDDIDAIEKAIEGAEIVVPRRQTFYGATEIFVREPAGNVVGFAQFATDA